MLQSYARRSWRIAFPFLVVQLIEVITIFGYVFQVSSQLEEFLVLIAILVTLAEWFYTET